MNKCCWGFCWVHLLGAIDGRQRGSPRRCESSSAALLRVHRQGAHSRELLRHLLLER